MSRLVATIVNADGLSDAALLAASDAARGAGATDVNWAWLEPGIAADLTFGTAAAAPVRAALEANVGAADVIVQPVAHRRRRLLIADMDSTMISCECIDELADYAGIKAEIAEVTERAMRGELDFVAALDARVKLLAGLDARVIDDALATRVHATPGGPELVGTMRAFGAHTVLVSGGFTVFADVVAARIGFDVAVANRLGISEGRLSGDVARPVVTAEVKRATLVEQSAARGIAVTETLAIGDGANDIAMIEAAGLGVAFRAKPRTEAAADAAIRHGDLSVLLYAQGYPRSMWRTTSR